MIPQIISRIKSCFISSKPPGKKRSSKWRGVRKKFLAKHPTCVACGGNEKLEAHHCVPFHIDKSKELLESNLITLCEKNNCHFVFGHLYNWQSYNVNVREDAAKMLVEVKNRP